MVTVSGTLQASFDGSGQYVSAQSQGQAPGSYPFNLVKVAGQWRINNPPDYRMLTASDFQLFYKAQDLYFFDPQDETLVPDSVFVPLGATMSQLLDNLVTALVAGPKTPWLQDAADTELPASSTVSSVTVAGSTATVNLGGPGDDRHRQAARAVLRPADLDADRARRQLPIQSVVLEINGKPLDARWPRPAAARDGYLPDADRLRVLRPVSVVAVQLLLRRRRPAVGPMRREDAGPAGTDRRGRARRRPWRRVQQPAVRHGRRVYENSTASPPAQPHSLPALSMAAVSPDGKYLAVVSAARNAVYLGRCHGGVVSFPAKPRLTAGGVTALSWDGNDDLWVADGGSVTMLPPGGGQVPVDFTGSVSDLSVAPDGVGSPSSPSSRSGLPGSTWRPSAAASRASASWARPPPPGDQTGRRHRAGSHRPGLAGLV